MQAIALVTGANRGIGLEVCRQLAQRGFTVILGSRDRGKGEQAARLLSEEGVNVNPHQLDVTDPASIDVLLAHVTQKWDWLDVLVNNAGINYDIWQKAGSTDLKMVRETLETNLFGAWRMCRAFLPLIRKSKHGRIVNVASEAGSFQSPYGLGSMEGALPAYGVSKAALNALTVKLAAEHKGAGVLVNSVCPGWSATAPGSEAQGARPIPDGAAGVVWAATLPDDGPTGGFFRDGKPLPW